MKALTLTPSKDFFYKETRPMEFKSLVLRSTTAGILEKIFPKYVRKSLPVTLGNFVLSSIYKKDMPYEPLFQYGIYVNKKGQKGIAKHWQGRFKNLSYYTLLNEIKTYKILGTAQERIRKNLPVDLEEVILPKLLYYKRDKKSLISLIEYIENTTDFSKKTARQKVNTYFSVVDYYNYLGSKLTSQEKAQFSFRTPLNHIILFPFVLIRSMTIHPELSWGMLRAVPTFIKIIPLLLKDKRIVLSHRDLKFKNMLIKGDDLYLIDLEYSVFTHPIYEDANTLHSYWQEDNYDKAFLKEAVKRYKGNKNDIELLRGYLVYTTIHMMNEKQYTKKKLNKYMNCLDFARRGKIK